MGTGGGLPQALTITFSLAARCVCLSFSLFPGSDDHICARPSSVPPCAAPTPFRSKHRLACSRSPVGRHTCFLLSKISDRGARSHARVNSDGRPKVSIAIQSRPMPQLCRDRSARSSSGLGPRGPRRCRGGDTEPLGRRRGDTEPRRHRKEKPRTEADPIPLMTIYRH